MSDPREIDEAIRTVEKFVSELPADFPQSKKLIYGKRATLEEIQAALNLSGDLVSEVREIRYFDAGGLSATVLVIKATAALVAKPLAEFLKKKNKKLKIKVKDKELTVENYPVEEVERIIKVFDGIEIE